MNIWSKGRRYAATALVLSGLFGAGLTLSPMSQADPNFCMPGQISCDGGDFGHFGAIWDNSNSMLRQPAAGGPPVVTMPGFGNDMLAIPAAGGPPFVAMPG